MPEYARTANRLIDYTAAGAIGLGLAAYAPPEWIVGAGTATLVYRAAGALERHLQRKIPRAEKERRKGIMHATWEVTVQHWIDGGLPNRPEYTSWVAPIIYPHEWTGGRLPELMRVPKPPGVLPNLSAYKEHLELALGVDDRPARLDLRMLANAVLIMPDRLRSRLLPELPFDPRRPYALPIGDGRRSILTLDPAHGNFPHWLFAGLTGYGKTNAAEVLLLGLLRARRHGVPMQLYVADPKRFPLDDYREAVDGFAPAPVSDRIRKALELLEAGLELPDDLPMPNIRQLEEAKLQEIRELVGLVHAISMGRQLRAGDRMGAKRLVEREGHVFIMVDEMIALFQLEQLRGQSAPAREAQARDAVRMAAIADLGQVAFMGREVGVHILGFTNRPDVTVIPGPVREQLIGRVAMRLGSDGSKMVCGDTRAFHRLPIDQPGRFWMIDPASLEGWTDGAFFDVSSDAALDEGIRARELAYADAA